MVKERRAALIDRVQELEHVQLGRRGRPVRIIQVTDTHVFPRGVKRFTPEPGRVVDFEKNGYDNFVAVSLLERLADAVSPDVAVLTGDIIDGRPFGEHKRRDWLETFRSFVQPLIDRKIWWTFVPGNHDDDGSPHTRKDLLDVYSLPFCLSTGARGFNHTLTIGPDPGRAVRIWLFDSGENSPDPHTKYTTWSAEAVKSYAEVSQQLRGKAKNKEQLNMSPPPGLAFFHIPLPEYAGIRPVCGRLGLFDAALCKGLVPWPASRVPWLVKALGLHRVVGSSKKNSGLFTEFVRQGNVLATFCGHDHYNDAVMLRQGIYLCYGRVGSRSPPIDWEGKGGALPFDLGARVIEADADTGKCRTWIQCASGVESDSMLQMQRGSVEADRVTRAQTSMRYAILIAVIFLWLLWLRQNSYP